MSITTRTPPLKTWVESARTDVVASSKLTRVIMSGGELEFMLLRKEPTKKQAENGIPGAPLAVLENAAVMLQHHPEFKGCLSFDEFSLKVLVAKKLPWVKPAGDSWDDVDYIRTCCWLQREGILVKTNIAAEAVRRVAMDLTFNPVKNYMNKLVWDGKPRLDSMLAQYFSSEDSEYTRAVGSCWLKSAVARVYQPGCQADSMLVLQGKQGILKSGGLRILGEPWFSDHISEMGSKDSRIETAGRLIIEISELDSMRRSRLEAIKAFIPCRFDIFRPPYGRVTTEVPRSCIFAGTTNSDTPLTDESGNRRFWVVRCGNVVDVQSLRRDKDQLWAEAVARYKGGERWHLDSAHLNNLATAEADKAYETGAWDDVIITWAENPTKRTVDDTRLESGEVTDPTESDKVAEATALGGRYIRVKPTEVLIHGIGLALTDINKPNYLQSVTRCLKHAGWSREQVSTGTWKGRRYYSKIVMPA